MVHFRFGLRRSDMKEMPPSDLPFFVQVEGVIKPYEIVSFMPFGCSQLTTKCGLTRNLEAHMQKRGIDPLQLGFPLSFDTFYPVSMEAFVTQYQRYWCRAIVHRAWAYCQEHFRETCNDEEQSVWDLDFMQM